MWKSTAFALSLLFALSSIYYLSFWSRFDIDIFQFLKVEDYIKGLVYPLRHGGALVIAITGFLAITISLFGILIKDEHLSWSGEYQRSEQSALAKKHNFFLIFAQILLCIGSFVFFMWTESPNLNFANGIAMAIAMNSTEAIDTLLNNKRVFFPPELGLSNKISALGEFIIRFSMVFLPFDAFLIGQAQANAILAGHKFLYTSSNCLPNNSEPSQYRVLIYIGKMSDDLIFISPDFRNTYFITRDEMSVFTTSLYYKYDTESVQHYRLALQNGLSCK